MKRLGGLLLIVVALAACVAGLYISAANRDLIVLDLLFWPQVTLRAGLALVLAFVAGAVAGLLVATLAAVRRRGRDLPPLPPRGRP